MADSKQADHWDLLASVLGAEPEKKEPGQPIWQAEEKKPETAEDIIIDDIIEDIIKDADAKASEAKSPSMAESPVEPAATSSPPPISTWDALAVELGIEVKPETARAPAPMRMSAPKQAEKKTAVRSEHQQEPFRQATAEFGERIEPFGISEPSSAEEPQEQREKKSHRRRRRHRKDRDTGHPGAKMEESSFGSQRDAPLEEDVFVSEASLETVDKSGAEIKEESNEEPGKGHSKHHRSRRGSRNRRKKGSESDREVGIDAKQAATAGHDAPAASSETPQGFEGEEEIADEDLEDRDERGAKSPFRAIPTWEEAVGCIVTKNMESRPRRQGSGPPRSRSGGDSHKRRRK